MRSLIRIYFAPYKRAVLSIILLLIVQVILQILIIYSVKPIVARGINETDTGLIIQFGVVMILLIGLYSAITITVARKAARISSESVCRIREDMFRKVLSFKRPRDSGANISGLMNRLVTDVNYIQDFMTEFLCIGLYVPLLAIGVIIATMFFSLFLSLAMAIALTVMGYTVFRIGKRELKIRSKLQRELDKTIHLFREFLVGARTARSFETDELQLRSFSEVNGQYSKDNVEAVAKVSYISSFATTVLMIMIVLIYGVLLIFTGPWVIAPSDAIIFIQYLVLFINCASITPFIITTVPQVKASFGRISKVMNGESEHSGSPIPEEYDGPLIACSNGFEINAGLEVSMVGRTGSGKSEFIRCLLRLDDVDPGTMTFKGVDITELDPKQLRRSVAYAGNMALVFRGTVWTNVDLGRNIPKEKMEKAFQAAKLELDPDTVLDGSGSNISMGQKQKISIARALATDAELYIFDDCFTELDPKTENEIVSNIRGMLKGKTLFFSSHQFRISPDSDVVSVMDDGKVIDTGRHNDLLDRCDIYRRMYLAGDGILE